MWRADSLEKTHAGKDWGQEEKGTTEDEMVGWHHWLNGYGSEQTPGDSEGWVSLACCSSCGRKESETTEWLNMSTSTQKLLKNDSFSHSQLIYRLNFFHWKEKENLIIRIFKLKDSQKLYNPTLSFYNLENWNQHRLKISSKWHALPEL